jgi:hypothetical protein
MLFGCKPFRWMHLFCSNFWPLTLSGYHGKAAALPSLNVQLEKVPGCGGPVGHKRHVWVWFCLICTHCSTFSLVWFIGLGLPLTHEPLLLWVVRLILTSSQSKIQNSFPRLWQLDGNPPTLHFLSWSWCSWCWRHKFEGQGTIISCDIINWASGRTSTVI